jgi:hypothetical protein
MTDTPDEPDWSLLPREPVRFFGLGEGFDRRELKRAYNELIRRFKPEKHPQEFQRIRAAFEQIDSGIRYGLEISSSSQQREEYQWSGESQPTTPGRRLSTTARPTVVPLHERLANGNVTEVYGELSAKSEKTPFDYYSLAVMSDIVDSKDELQFARWLLAGIAAHRNEVGLLRLLHAYLRGHVPENAREQLLLECSKAVHETAFFPLTEPLWRALLTKGEFAQFRITLQKCEANLKGLSIDGRLAFYLQILKPAIWTADDAWIAEALNLIERNFERIPRFLEYEVEMVSRLRKYHKHRQLFAEGHPLLQQLDRALRDHFTEEQQVGDRSVLECQMLILGNKEALAAVFSERGNLAYAAFLDVWAWVSYDVAERNVQRREQTYDENMWYDRTQTLLAQLARQTKSSGLGRNWAIAALSFQVGQLLCYLLAIGLALVVAITVGPSEKSSRSEAIVAFASIFSIILGGLIGHWLKGKLNTKLWPSYCRQMSAKCYRRIWQPEILEFLSRSHLPYRMLVAFISHAANSAIENSLWIKHYVADDFALPMYSIAQRFVV